MTDSPSTLSDSAQSELATGLNGAVPPPEISGEGIQREAYLDFLGLRRNPFPVSPDNEHFFMPTRIDALISEVVHSIFTRKGFMVITGEVGLGKTTISQRIMRLLDAEGVESALVFNTFLQGLDLLNEIIRDFGLDSRGETLPAGVEILNRFLIDRYANGRNCAIIIDDAQNLSMESLELIRMISNLETNAEKLVQILLVGQPELMEKLDSHELRQLKSRVVINVEVQPLSREELKQYIFFKLSAVGDQGGLSISDRSFGRLHAFTQGNPRRINNLMDRCLYGLFAYNVTRLGPGLVREAAAEMGFVKPRMGWRAKTVQIAAPIMLLLGLGGGAWGIYLLNLAGGGDPAELGGAEMTRLLEQQEAVREEVENAAGALDELVARIQQNQGELERAREELAKLRAARESARARVAEAQMGEAEALTRAARAGQVPAERDANQQRLERARAGRLAVEQRVEDLEQRIERGLVRVEEEEEGLARLSAQRAQREARLGQARTELEQAEKAAAIRSRALSTALASQERSRVEAEQARRLMAQARQEAETQAAQAAAQAQAAEQRARELDAAQTARAQAESEAIRARTEAEQALAAVRAAQAEARERLARLQNQVASQEAESRAALAEAEAARRQAEAEAAQARTEAEQALAQVALTRENAEGLAAQLQRESEAGSAVDHQRLEALRVAEQARLAAQAEAEQARSEVEALQRQAREAQAHVESMRARLSEAAPPAVEDEIDPEVARFLEASRLSRFGPAFQRSLNEGYLEFAAERIGRESGYRLARLSELPAGLENKYHALSWRFGEGASERLLFWKPPVWFDLFYFGMRDPTVRRLQEALARKGLYVYQIDGIVGRRTLNALTRFQRENGLPLTGRPDSETLLLLFEEASTTGPGEAATVGNGWVVQAGSFRSPVQTRGEVLELREHGFSVYSQKIASSTTGELWEAVRIGPFSTFEEARRQQAKLVEEMGREGIILEVPGPSGDVHSAGPGRGPTEPDSEGMDNG